MPPRIAAVATRPPDHDVSQAVARDFAARHFNGRLKGLDRLLGVFDHAGIASRQLAESRRWYSTAHGFKEKNDAYIARATELGADAARRALDQAGLRPEQVDHLIFVSTTGMATPSIDARIATTIGLDAHVSRVPVFGLGCAGGAMGLAQAANWCRGRPGGIALLVDVELCSLTFQHDDFSKANLVATALFGDGAAAAVIGGEESGLEGPEIVAQRSTLWRDSLDVMGWTFLDEGMQVVFSREIPAIVREKTLEEVDAFLGDQHLSREDISRFVFHPGGRKVLEAYEDVLELDDQDTAISREVLRRHGNMSSATILYVLAAHLDASAGGNGTPRTGPEPDELDVVVKTAEHLADPSPSVPRPTPEEGPPPEVGETLAAPASSPEQQPSPVAAPSPQPDPVLLRRRELALAIALGPGFSQETLLLRF